MYELQPIEQIKNVVLFLYQTITQVVPSNATQQHYPVIWPIKHVKLLFYANIQRSGGKLFNL